MLLAFQSRPHPGSPRNLREAGFSLIEILLALGLTVLLMTIASQLIFSMKRSSDRMRISAEARLRGQKALDYLTSNIRGATDMNPRTGNPASLMTWYKKGGANLQASWNNVTNANLADVGTDILTIARASSVTYATAPTFGSTNSSTPTTFLFAGGCPNSSDNIAVFKDLTGNGEPVLLVDAAGAWGFYQITDYLDGTNAGSCTLNPPEIQATANPGAANLLESMTAPGSFIDPVKLMLSVQFFTFRVRDGWLEQKLGLFDPATDNPGTAFSPLIPNIDDFQVAWVFRDGTVWNSSAQQLPAGTYTNNIPAQGTTLAQDVINCTALRVSIVARSAEELTWDPVALFSRPTVEDRAGGTNDRFFHHRATTLVMIRNRNLLF